MFYSAETDFHTIVSEWSVCKDCSCLIVIDVLPTIIVRLTKWTPAGTFLHLADAFIQSDLQCIRAINVFFIITCVPWELNPQPFALLTQCSTIEPQVVDYVLTWAHFFNNLFMFGFGKAFEKSVSNKSCIYLIKNTATLWNITNSNVFFYFVLFSSI